MERRKSRRERMGEGRPKSWYTNLAERRGMPKSTLMKRWGYWAFVLSEKRPISDAADSEGAFVEWMDINPTQTRRNPLREEVEDLRRQLAAAQAQAPEEKLSLKAQQKLDCAIKKAHKRLQEAFTGEVLAEVEKRVAVKVAEEREKLHQLMEQAKAERDRAIELRRTIDAYMTQAEYKMLRGCVHPDKHPEEDRAKYGKAFELVTRLEKMVNPKTPTAILRKRGWEAKNPYDKPRKSGETWTA